MSGYSQENFVYATFLIFICTGLAHVPCFNSIGKLTTRSDLHRTADWPYNSASRGHEIWHEVVLTHGRPWMAAINLWQFYPVSLIGLPMPLFQSHGKPNTPAFIRGLGDWPDEIASNEVCCDFEILSRNCHLRNWIRWHAAITSVTFPYFRWACSIRLAMPSESC